MKFFYLIITRIVKRFLSPEFSGREVLIIFIIFLFLPQIVFAEPEFNPDPDNYPWPGVVFEGYPYEFLYLIYIDIGIYDDSCACLYCDNCVTGVSFYDAYGCNLDNLEWNGYFLFGWMTCPMITGDYHPLMVDVDYLENCICCPEEDVCDDASPPAHKTYYANLAPQPFFYDESCEARYPGGEWYVDINFNFEDSLDENLYDIQDATIYFADDDGNDVGIGECSCYPYDDPYCSCTDILVEDFYWTYHWYDLNWHNAYVVLEITDQYGLTESFTETYEGYEWYYWYHYDKCEYNEYPGDDDCETTCPDYCDTGSDPDVAYSDGYRIGDPDSYCECMYNIETSCPYGCDGDICNTSPPDPVVDLKADGSDGPITILSGTSATLSWTSANVASCTASGDWSGEKALSGSESTGSLVSSKTYVLVCDTVSDSVTVNVNQEPIAGASAEGQCSYPPERIPGTSISLETNNAGCLSQDPDGQIIRFDWDFQDGNTYSCCNSGCNKKITGNNCNTNHTYTSSGLFVAELKVTDDDGAQIIDTLTIEICSPACENDGDCQDGYICNNPGTCAAICTEEPVPLIIKWWREIIPFIFE